MLKRAPIPAKPTDLVTLPRRWSFCFFGPQIPVIFVSRRLDIPFSGGSAKKDLRGWMQTLQFCVSVENLWCAILIEIVLM